MHLLGFLICLFHEISIYSTICRRAEGSLSVLCVQDITHNTSLLYVKDIFLSLSTNLLNEIRTPLYSYKCNKMINIEVN